MNVDQKETETKYHVFRHACGGVMRIGITPSSDGSDTETYAVCDKCNLAILICRGVWLDERFQAGLEALHSGGTA